MVEARANDVIEIDDEEHVESLTVDSRPGFTTAVTIQAAPGKTVVWKPSDKDERRPLIRLSKANRFVLKGPGITLDGTIDGKRRLKNVVEIFGYSTGLTLEDLDFKSFSQAAVLIMNCQGEDGKPVRLLNLRAALTDNKQAAVFFNAAPSVQPPFNDFIEISGPGNFSVQLKDSDNSVIGKNVTWPGK
jgi:hypothetical protein